MCGRYLEKACEMFKWAKCKFSTERYNIDTSDVVESHNGFFSNV